MEAIQDVEPIQCAGNRGYSVSERRTLPERRARGRRAARSGSRGATARADRLAALPPGAAASEAPRRACGHGAATAGVDDERSRSQHGATGSLRRDPRSAARSERDVARAGAGGPREAARGAEAAPPVPATIG